MNIGIIQSHVFDSLRTDMTGQDIAQFDRKLAFRYLDQRIPIFIVLYQALKGHGGTPGVAVRRSTVTVPGKSWRSATTWLKISAAL